MTPCLSIWFTLNTPGIKISFQLANVCQIDVDLSLKFKIRYIYKCSKYSSLGVLTFIIAL